MTLLQILLLGVTALVVIGILLAVIVRLGGLRGRAGDERRGLAILCGGLRWGGGRWGLRCVPAGLRAAGFEGRFIYWPWHGRWSGPLLTVPAIWDKAMHQSESQKIADHIVSYRRDHPHAPIYLLGCSAGGWLAVRTLTQLPPDVSVTSVALLSAAVSPDYDLTEAMTHVDESLINSCSWLDLFILGLGTMLVGTGDRKRTASCGMVGLTRAHPRVVNLRWRVGMIKTGRMGGHASCTPPAYLARYIAPLMGIAPR